MGAPPPHAAAAVGEAPPEARRGIMLAIATPVRLLGEALVQALQVGSSIDVVGVAHHLSSLRQIVREHRAHVALIDVSTELDFDEARMLAAERPDTRLLALGARERQVDVIRYARAGFISYVPRDVPLRELEGILVAAAYGRTYCSAEIAAGLMQALFRPGPGPEAPEREPAFTRRECEILHLLGRGLSNKAIARDLALSLGTVKNHVHNVLTKLGAGSRLEATRAVRDRPWIASHGA
jgi:DNA-binding NarL/FixJ family response regulator